ncbi:hypothetical protein [Streptomyces cellulosae]|uniref:Uncharacterized protein n=1 Tax=Streptomyces cellulosae TaxID=1968 RepID=A0ABW7Y9D8_STRCE
MTAFERALGDGAYDRMCTALAPGTPDEVEQSAGSPCPKALGEEPPPPGGAVRLVDAGD